MARMLNDSGPRGPDAFTGSPPAATRPPSLRRWSIVILAVLPLLASVGMGVHAQPVDDPVSKPVDDPLSPEERAWLEAHGPIRIAPRPDFAPFSFSDPEGGLQGIELDLMNRISRNLDIDFEIVQGNDWEAMDERLRAGEVDVMTPVRASPERDAYMDFLDPHVQVRLVLYTRVGQAYENVSALDGQRVAVVEDTATMERFSESHPNITLVPVADVAEGFSQLDDGSVAAFLTSAVLGGYYLQAEGRIRFHTIDPPVETVRLHWGVQENATMLRGILQRGMDSVSPGDRQLIFSFWTGQDISVPPDPADRPAVSPLARNLIIAALMLAATAAVWGFTLRRQVRVQTEKLREGRDALQRHVAIMEASSEAIIGLTTDGLIRSWNLGSCETYGYTAQEMVGRPAFDLAPPELHGENHGLMERVLAGERILHHESEGLRKDATRIPVSVSLSPVTDAAGQVVGIAHVSRDITLERDLQAQQVQAAQQEARLQQIASYERMKRQFLNRAAHELRTPLTPLMLEVNMIERLEVAKSDPKVQGSVKRLSRSAGRLLRVADQIIEVVRLESHVGVSDPVAFDLADAADRVVATAGESAPENVVVRRTGDASAQVSGRQEEILRTMTHLVNNAINFRKNGLDIEVEVRREDGGARVEVHDSGRGFPADQAQHIFDAFPPTGEADDDAAEGLGLGLYEVRLVVEGHGGRTWASSPGPGRGATFGFFLPRTPRGVETEAGLEGFDDTRGTDEEE